MFNIDYNALVRKLMPHFLRQIKFVDFVQSGVKALKDVNNLLVTLQTDLEFKTAFDSRVIYLQEFLNIKHDPTLKRIFIKQESPINFVYIFLNIESITPSFIFLNSESKPPLFIRLFSEIGGDIDFTVMIPSSITFDSDEITAQVNTYNAAGKRFALATF